MPDPYRNDRQRVDRANMPEELNTDILRADEVIMADLRKQLEAIHSRYLAKWVYPCRR